MSLTLVDPDEVEKSIILRIDDLCERPETRRWNGGKWTRETKNVLVALGHERRLTVRARTCDGADGGEWLFDLCWRDQDRPILRSVPLAAEIEWKPVLTSTLKDFQKLIVARAEHRLMLFVPEGRGANPGNSIRKLIHEVQDFRLGTPGDRYLIGCWNEGKSQFRWQCFELRRHPKE